MAYRDGGSISARAGSPCSAQVTKSILSDCNVVSNSTGSLLSSAQCLHGHLTAVTAEVLWWTIWSHLWPHAYHQKPHSTTSMIYWTSYQPGWFFVCRPKMVSWPCASSCIGALDILIISQVLWQLVYIPGYNNTVIIHPFFHPSIHPLSVYPVIVADVDTYRQKS